MPTAEWTTPENIETALRILTWVGGGLTVLWIISAIVSYSYRRSYNLTHAESGRSKDVKPDFLKVDKAKRDAAIARGEAYNEVLEARERTAVAPPTEAMGRWARFGALSTAIFTFVAAIVGTVSKVDVLQENLARISTWDKFTTIVRENPVASFLAFFLIGANVIIFVNAIKKSRRKA